MTCISLESLSDKNLVEKLGLLRSKESEAIAEVVLHLAELNRRQAFRELGFSSLFAFCTVRLGYSEGATCRRISAARCLVQHPKVYEQLRTGAVSLCALAEVAKLKENSGPVLELAEGKSKREVERLVAERLPAKASKRERIVLKKVKLDYSEPDIFNFQALSASPPPAVETRYSVNFEADAEFMSLLEQAKAFSEAYGLAEVLKKTLHHYLSMKSPVERYKRRQAKKRAKKVTATTTVTRHIPVKIRDEVYVRDGGQCCFSGTDGNRCAQTKNLQIDHIRPWAMNGSHEADNLRLLCPAHNRLAAERIFGPRQH